MRSNCVLVQLWDYCMQYLAQVLCAYILTPKPKVIIWGAVSRLSIDDKLDPPLKSEMEEFNALVKSLIGDHKVPLFKEVQEDPIRDIFNEAFNDDIDNEEVVKFIQTDSDGNPVHTPNDDEEPSIKEEMDEHIGQG
eukprot:3555926-Ditylum_brightwellii.AAC.1